MYSKTLWITLSFFGFFFYSSNALAATEVTTDILKPTVWTKGGSPYIIKPKFSSLSISTSLSIEPGVVVKFRDATTSLNILSTGSISAIGFPEERIVFTSIKDDANGGDTNGDGSATSPKRGEWYAIINNGALNFENVSVLYGSSSPATAGIYSRSNSFRVKDSLIQDNLYAGIGLYNVLNVEITGNTIARNGVGIYVYRFTSGTTLKISGNTLSGNEVFGARIDGLLWWHPEFPLDLRDNWWGDPSGPYYKPSVTYGVPYASFSNEEGKGNKVGDGVLFDPWLKKDPFVLDPECTENCFSNVLFLPGIKASHLYTDGVLGTEDELWIPNVGGDDAEALKLDLDGKSIESVYTKDVVESILTGNIYESFLEVLLELKGTGMIQDYRAFAYDWRMNVEDIVRDGTPYPNGENRSVVSELLSLAEDSKSKKVTIVAHSNGGLLAKALMMELEREGKSDLVDTVIFVGTPQMGTPMSILSLLYGYDEPIPVAMSQGEARDLAETMLGAYGLLPSKTYLERLREESLVEFSSERTRYKIFRDTYGVFIDSFHELQAFLSGSGDGRTEPSEDDIESENTLREKFLLQAAETHERLDEWSPPEGVKVIQIAGWGLDTVKGVKYTEKEKTLCFSVPGGKVPSCAGVGEYEPMYEPEFTVDGDRVVVAPSALMMSESENVKRYWVDLYRSNKIFTNGREHRDILEFSGVKEFLSEVIQENVNEFLLPNYITKTRPNDYDDASSRIRLSLYSPLDIHFYDDLDRHTGPKKMMIDGSEVTMFEEGIPNSTYYQFDDRKYISFESGEHIRVEMDGYDEGSYTLKLEEILPKETGDKMIFHTTFQNLPTTANTVVTLDIPSSGLADLSPLMADYDGDEINDYRVFPVPNGIVTLDVIPPTTEALLSGTEGTNGWYASDVSIALIAKDNEGGSGVEKTEYSLDGGKTWEAYEGTISFMKEGVYELQYFSSDRALNDEVVQYVNVKIDKNAPEAKITFDSERKGLEVIAGSSASPVSIEKSEKIARLTDEAGHTTELSFEKLDENGKQTKVRLASISYDNAMAIPVSAILNYEWSVDKLGALQILNSKAETDGKMFHFQYLSQSGETKIIQGEGLSKKIDELLFLSLETEKGVVKITF